MASLSSRYLFDNIKDKNTGTRTFNSLEIALDYVTTVDLESLLLENGHDLDRAVILYESEGTA